MKRETSSQAPSYARRLQPKTMTHSLTGVKCRATSVAKNQTMNPIFFFQDQSENCKIPPFWCSLQNSQMKTPLMLLESPGGYLLLTGKSDILSVFKNRYRGGILECRQTIPLKIPPLGFSDVIGKPETSY